MSGWKLFRWICDILWCQVRRKNLILMEARIRISFCYEAYLRSVIAEHNR